MSRAAHDRSRRGLLVGIVVVAASLCAFLTVSPTGASWTVGQVGTTADSAATGGLAFAHSGGCAAGPAASGTTTCSGTVLPTSETSATGPVTGTDSITDNGTVPAGRLSQSVSAASCAPVKLDDSKGSDPLLPRYGTAFRQSDGWGTTSAVGLSGGAYAADAAGLSTGSLLGASFTIAVRFKVANGYASGGGLISLAGSPARSGSAAGPVAVWMDNAGKIRFYLAGTLGTSSAGVSAAAYNDGAWHLAVLSVGALAVSTPTLYVDGTSVGGIGLSLLTGATAYWHVGWADLTGVSAGAPTSSTLTGSLSGAFVSASATSASTVGTLASAAGASAYSTTVLGISGVQRLWMLGDTGATTYTGSLAPSMSAPCGQVDVAFSFASPAATIAKQSIAAFVAGGAVTVAAPGPGTTQTMTVGLTRGSGWNADVAGLRLLVPLTVTETTSPSSTWSLAFTWTAASSVVLA